MAQKKEKSTLGSTFFCSKVFFFCHFSEVQQHVAKYCLFCDVTYFFKSSQSTALPTKVIMINDGVHCFDSFGLLIVANVIPAVVFPMLTPLVSMKPPFWIGPTTIFLTPIHSITIVSPTIIALKLQLLL